MSEKIKTKAFYNYEIPGDWEIEELGQLTILCTNGFVGKAKESYDEGRGQFFIYKVLTLLKVASIYII